MRGSAFVAGVLFVASSARVAAAGPDPYSPASAPPAAFFGGPAPQTVRSSFVPRSPTLEALGVVLVVVGGLTLVSAPIVGAASTSPAGDPTKSSSTDGAVAGLLIGGVALVAAGIPIVVYGSKPVPPPSSTKAARLEPAPGGVRFVF